MEMHQIRYFLAMSETLNFTRAAEKCNVAQPSLTRAIKKLEEEFGGDLFRRERSHTHLTELGRLMLPIMQQTYSGASAAKELAGSLRQGARAPLSLALSNSINTSLISPFLGELARTLPGLEIQILRGTSNIIAQYLKDGTAELALTGPIGDDWERFDMWPLFAEDFVVLVPCDHALATKQTVDFQELAGLTVLSRSYCEHRAEFVALYESCDLRINSDHMVPSDQELVALVEANLGIAFVPASTSCPNTVQRLDLNGVDCRRLVNLYSVSGRQRSQAGITLMEYLRATNWGSRVRSKTTQSVD